MSLTHLRSSPGVKSAICQIKSRYSERTPCIVHLPNFKSLLDVYASRFIEELGGALKEVTPNGLIISTSTIFESEIFADASFVSENEILELIFENKRPQHNESQRHWWSRLSETKILQTTGVDPKTQLIRLVPSNSRTQRLLFDKHRKHDSSNERRNIRLLQNSIRKLPIELCKLSILQPYADWTFLNGTPAQEKLVKNVLDQDELDGILRDLGHEPTVGHAGERGTANGQVTDAKIKEVILTFGYRVKALEEWSDNVEDESKWSSFPSWVQNKIREIEDDDSFEWEQKFLDFLINPNDLEEGWSEIALEPDIKEAIQQLIHQPTNTWKYSYGILKRARIGGALLYGPPGTGKTHLARVLARESKAITICASAAALINTYVGETEKAIQALFNLGRMLSPCTIFLDEADALFRSRKPNDKSWERNQVNQMLHEMDGLKKFKSSPFVLLATNFPHDLDIAVLRRVPSRIHIGLPSFEARHQIFQMCLADEILHSNMDLRRLAEISQGYSGSDIQTVCVQAALICDAVTDVNARRVLMSIHFDKAFQRCAPTVSKRVLNMIKAFSREYDPAALERTEQLGKSGPLPKITSQLPCEEGKKTSGRYDLPQKHIKMSPIGTVEEIEDHVNGTAVDEPEGSYRYLPLQPESMQIRVLSVLPRGNKSDKFLRCTLRTVDLNDWTTEYRAVSSKLDDAGLPNTPKLRLALWRQEISLRRGHQNFRISRGDRYTEETLKKYLTKFMDDDFLLEEEKHGISHRFNWGDYIALSYVWGEVNDKKDILLDGHRFPVTNSLYEALSHLRDVFKIYDREFHIWADAVCINQSDPEERAKEVKKMASIYSQCSSVRGWLVGSTPEIASDLPAVRHFLNSISDVSLRDMMSDSVIESIISSDARHSLEAVLSHLFSCPFWERLWTIQEVALAPRILFHYGQEAFTSEEISKLFLMCSPLLFSGQSLHKLDHRHLDGPIKAHERLAYLHSNRGVNLVQKVELDSVEIMILARSSKSMDPKDKVYGLLALLPQSIAERIEPNYDHSFSVQDTFINLSKTWYEATGNLDSLARVDTSFSPLPNLPSWTMDLSTQTDGNKNAILPLSAPGLDRVGRANHGMPTKQLMFSDNNRLLFCEGCMVDAVASTGLIQIGAVTDMFGHDITIKDEYIMYAKGELAMSGIAIAAPDRDWKLTLARVLNHDSCYEFSESPSVLDIPWPDPATLDTDFADTRIPLYYAPFDNEGPRSMFWQAEKVSLALLNQFSGNEDFDIGGKPFRDYFASSTDTGCLESAEYISLVRRVLYGFNGRRLCKTENGLLGSASHYARLGDKIAVLSNCDMPMVLRPKGQHYEVVGGCFVEGLMRGEAARGIEQGLYPMERFSLC